MYVFNNKMPATYYGLVRKIGPYKQTASDKAHLNEKQPLFVGGGVWAGGSTHSGHGEWLMVNDAHGNYETKQQLGFPKTSDYNTPSVVVSRRQDVLAQMSADQRRDFYYQGMFQKRPAETIPFEPIESPTEATVNPIVLPSGQTIQLPTVPSIPDLAMDSPVMSLPATDFMSVDFDDLGYEGRGRPTTTEQSTMTSLAEKVAADVETMAKPKTRAMETTAKPETTDMAIMAEVAKADMGTMTEVEQQLALTRAERGMLTALNDIEMGIVVAPREAYAAAAPRPLTITSG